LHVSLSMVIGRSRLGIESAIQPIAVIASGILGVVLTGMFVYQMVLVGNNWTTLEAFLLSRHQTYKDLSWG
jgi:hypothetical protein